MFFLLIARLIYKNKFHNLHIVNFLYSSHLPIVTSMNRLYLRNPVVFVTFQVICFIMNIKVIEDCEYTQYI